MEDETKNLQNDDSLSEDHSTAYNVWLQTVKKQNYPAFNRASCHKLQENQLLFFGGINQKAHTAYFDLKS